MTPPTTTHLLHYGETAIPYTLTYARRKTVAIHVYPDQRVEVKAPEGSDFAAVEDFVRRRAAWIARKRAQFALLPAARPPRRYVSGEKIGRAHV